MSFPSTVVECALRESPRDIQFYDMRTGWIELADGEMSLHSPSLVHDSLTNFSSRRRCGVTSRVSSQLIEPNSSVGPIVTGCCPRVTTAIITTAC